jgi:hypothetical protein
MEKQTSFDSEEYNSEEEGLDTTPQTKTKEDESPKLQNKSLIKAISQTLESILQNNKQLPNFKEILKSQAKMVFSANLIPNISIEDYLIRIQMYSNIEKSTLIISLILIDRLCQLSNLTLTYHNIHRIIFSAILISIKYNEDTYYDNKYYAEIAGVTLKELKILEYSFLSMVHFKLFIQEELYDKYIQYLDNIDFDKK